MARYVTTPFLPVLLMLMYGASTAKETPYNFIKDPGRHLTNAETTDLLDELINRMDYRVRPNVDGGGVLIRCGFFIINFGSISDSSMDYSMDIYLRQEWYDNRLSFTNATRPLTINSQLVSKMWTPDLFFPTEKKASFHDVTVPNKLMRVYPDGKVIYSMRLTLTLACPMDLSHFPMDHQQCDFMMESYSHEEEDLLLEWFDDDAVELEDDIELPQFDLLNVTTMKCDARKYKTGYYPCVKAMFTLKRQYGFFLLQTYIPSILIVIISWISFWINMDAVPARISLGVTTVLTMATQLSGSKASIPRISYPKAIDIWMATCMLFVFGALIEYAFVNALARKDKRRRASMYKKNDGDEDEMQRALPQEDSNEKLDLRSLKKCLTKRQTARMVDKTSRVMFPLSFLIFNFVYWLYFTYPRI